MDIAEKLTGTLACDEDGHPLVLHHGTFESFMNFEKTRDIGFHFGSLAQANARREDKARELRLRMPGEWRVMKVALAVRKVIVFPDDAGDWTNWSAISGLARLVDPDFLSRMKQAGMTESRVVARHLRDLMVEMGYDAVVYRNLHEGECGAIAEWSWLVLDSQAIVNLPSSRDGVLDIAVGASPGLDLPSSSRDIPGARNRNGNVRFQSDRRELIHAVRALVEADRGSMSPPRCTWSKDDDNSFEFEFCGLKGQLQSGIGCLALEVPEEHREVFDEVVDDFVAYVGLERRNTAKLIYEWQPGETANAFLERMKHGLDRFIQAVEAGMAPSP